MERIWNKMSDIVEKNDVNISKLFDWGRVFEIVDPRDEDNIVLVYMKLLGDADLGRARTYAVRKSAEMRRKLKDLNSDERVAYIRTIDEMTLEELVNMIIVFSGRELSNKVRTTVKIPTPKPPKSNSKLEKSEKFQKEVDEYPQKRAQAIADALSKEVDLLRQNLNKRGKEELYNMYVIALVDEFCEREAMVAFEDMQTYLGCYTDDTYKPDKLFFKEFEEFNNLEPSVKTQFKDAYRSIDIELSELKKLRRATL
jgi:hypothetical protein